VSPDPPREWTPRGALSREEEVALQSWWFGEVSHLEVVLQESRLPPPVKEEFRALLMEVDGLAWSGDFAEVDRLMTVLDARLKAAPFQGQHRPAGRTHWHRVVRDLQDLPWPVVRSRLTNMASEGHEIFHKFVTTTDRDREECSRIGTCSTWTTPHFHVWQDTDLHPLTFRTI
jgi:hypothetical protein